MTHRILQFVILVLFIYFALDCISVALTSQLSFDGAMNVQVAQNLAAYSRYATSYPAITDFDQRIQTGAPVIFPAALVIKLFGASSQSVLMISALYMIALLGLILYYLHACLRVDLLFLIPAQFLFYATPDIFPTGIGFIGEIPSLVYLLAALILLHRYDRERKGLLIWSAGICLGLAILVKTVMLIVIPALLFAALFDVLIKRRLPVLTSIRHYLLMLTGVVIPVALFELYRLFSLSYAGYLDWWQAQSDAIFRQAGVADGFADTPEIGSKLWVHLELLSSDLGLSPGFVAVILCLMLVLFLGICFYGLRQIRKPQQDLSLSDLLHSNGFLVLITVTLSYFGWWLLITPTDKAWFRRIINGTLLLEICIVAVVFWLYTVVRARWAISNKIPDQAPAFAVALLLSVLPLVNMVQTERYRISFEPTQSKLDLIAASSFIQSLPESAEFFGYGWWQAPIVAFEAGEQFKNINLSLEMNEVGEKSEKYLVVDRAVFETANQEYQQILSIYEDELVFSRGGNKIYQLVYRLPYAEFTDEDRQQADTRSIDFKQDVPSGILRNVYVDEQNGGGKWAQPYSGYLLKHHGENTLRLVIWVDNPQVYDVFPFDVEISINDQLYSSQKIDREGANEILLPLEGVPDGSMEVALAAGARIIAPDDVRQLSIFLQQMELIDR